jgi:uncharacterized protein YqjF (DUF2071 family)
VAMRSRPLALRAASRDQHSPKPFWQWSQEWRDLVFLHWPAPTDQVQRLLPRGLVLDEFESRAWISIVAFRLAGVRLGPLPPLGRFSNFLEVNLRTYVRLGEEPAVYFIRMLADSRLAIAAAHWLTPLPYRFALLAACKNEERWHWSVTAGTADSPTLHADLQTIGSAALLERGSLEEWLLERYRAAVVNRRGNHYRMAVRHEPWQVQPVATCDLSIRWDSPWGECLRGPPELAHFSPGLEAWIEPITRV